MFLEPEIVEQDVQNPPLIPAVRLHAADQPDTRGPTGRIRTHIGADVVVVGNRKQANSLLRRLRGNFLGRVGPV